MIAQHLGQAPQDTQTHWKAKYEGVPRIAKQFFAIFIIVKVSHIYTQQYILCIQGMNFGCN